MELVLSDSTLADLVNRGNNVPESLGPEEWQRFSTYTFMVINAWEYGYYLDRKGAVQQEVFEGANAYWTELAANRPGMRKYWQENEHAFGEPFRSYARSQITTVRGGSQPEDA